MHRLSYPRTCCIHLSTCNTGLWPASSYFVGTRSDHSTVHHSSVHHDPRLHTHAAVLLCLRSQTAHAARTPCTNSANSRPAPDPNFTKATVLLCPRSRKTHAARHVCIQRQEQTSIWCQLHPTPDATRKPITNQNLKTIVMITTCQENQHQVPASHPPTCHAEPLVKRRHQPKQFNHC